MRAAATLKCICGSSPAEIMGSPLPLSLGSAEVAGGYRESDNPVKVGYTPRTRIPQGLRPREDRRGEGTDEGT